MSQDLTKPDQSLNALNSLIMSGDMSKLSQQQKLDYYHGICKSVGLNPLTKPFEYMRLNGKEVLYATKGAAEQLRNIKGISVTSQHIEWADDLVIVTVEGKDRDGRVDTETGFAQIGNLKGDAKGNALLKAITKAKRRLTLSMAGLGMLDETEVDSIPAAEKIKVKDEIAMYQVPFAHQLTKRGENNDWATWARNFTNSVNLALNEDIEEWLQLNQDLIAQCLTERPDIHEKIMAKIQPKIDIMLDATGGPDE